jgi:LmbE family N-acetylglucosaminyl deacetylase
MLPLNITVRGRPTKILCLGAHADDIEIGVGGTLISWLSAGAEISVTWCVLSGGPDRAVEARNSAEAFLDGAHRTDVQLANFRDSYFPEEGIALKEWFEALRGRIEKPDVIFCHRRDDAHQDHREVSRLTWNAFRDHLILEYEIPKWDGDLGQPNSYVALSADVMNRKLELLHAHFPTQKGKDWFDQETFRGLARIRGMECRAPERYAEAFYVRKLLLESQR